MAEPRPLPFAPVHRATLLCVGHDLDDRLERHGLELDDLEPPYAQVIATTRMRTSPRRLPRTPPRSD